jgi:hypothetical protein
MMHPRVFVSHASEDKERFVVEFATKLRAKGIDAWLDKWEILPGDSLVDKIYDEGLKGAQAVIVVLSRNSVNKPWVRDELNAAVVKKINGLSKLIPVVIDDCEVPEALQSTVWERIDNFASYEGALERIVRAILNHREKPPIGDLPLYATTLVDRIPGLTETDTLILKLSCEKAIERKYPLVEAKDFYETIKSHDIHEEDYYECLAILDSRKYIEGYRVADATDRINRFRITLFGFDQYARSYLSDYDKLIEAISFQIVNIHRNNSLRIANALNLPIMIVNHVFDLLESKGMVVLSHIATGDHRVEVASVSPELKRWLRSV